MYVFNIKSRQRETYVNDANFHWLDREKRIWQFKDKAKNTTV